MLETGSASLFRLAKQPFVHFIIAKYARQLAVAPVFVDFVGEVHAAIAGADPCHDLFRLRDGHCLVQLAVLDPQRDLSQFAAITHISPATERDCTSDSVGVFAREIEGAVATQAHPDDVDAVAVGIVLRLDVVEDIEDLVGVPGGTRLHLRGKNDAWNLAATHDFCDNAILLDELQIGAREAAAMQKNQDRRLRFKDRIRWQIQPKRVISLACNGLQLRKNLAAADHQHGNKDVLQYFHSVSYIAHQGFRKTILPRNFQPQ
jgi:hypothetical protein